MPITPTEAADIAKRFGLGLQDAAGLMSLAKDADDAADIAKRFAEPDTAAASLELTRQLFGRKPATEPDDEGQAPSPDLEARRFARRLFDTQ